MEIADSKRVSLMAVMGAVMIALVVFIHLPLTDQLASGDDDMQLDRSEVFWIGTRGQGKLDMGYPWSRALSIRLVH